MWNKTQLRSLKIIFIISSRNLFVCVIKLEGFCFLGLNFIGSKYLAMLFFSLYQIIINAVSKIYLNQHFKA